MEEDQLHKQFKLERLGDGEMFLEATCQLCRRKFTIDLYFENIKERLKYHVEKCHAAQSARTI